MGLLRRQERVLETFPKKRCPKTISVRAGVDVDESYGAVTPSPVLTSNFSFEAFGQKRPYDYTRTGNPTRDTLGQAIADLEGGHNAVITSSGLSAINLVLAALTPDDLVIAPHDCYGGTYRLLRERARLGHFRVDFVDLTDDTSLRRALSETPKVVVIETPSNPLLRITDIAAVAELAHAVGALVVADNTFLSPVLQQPLALGADIVVHSLTKYLNGHSDVVGGAVVSQTAELHENFAWWANVTGVTGAPFDSWLVLRGMRTLDLRVKEQSNSAAEIAQFLDRHPSVAKVYYPGLRTHPGHELACRQQAGFGAMLSFELKDTDLVEPFVNLLARRGGLFSLAESLGGFESLIAHPATMTHASITESERQTAGISDRLLRLSIGLESTSDLVTELEDSFNTTAAARAA
jgi:cystathionine gamma-synthase